MLWSWTADGSTGRVDDEAGAWTKRSEMRDTSHHVRFMIQARNQLGENSCLSGFASWLCIVPSSLVVKHALSWQRLAGLVLGSERGWILRQMCAIRKVRKR